MAGERELTEALERLVNAKALKDIRSIVAGWNGESLPDGRRYERHPPRTRAAINTTCGAIYDLDEAIEAGRAALSRTGGDDAR